MSWVDGQRMNLTAATGKLGFGDVLAFLIPFLIFLEIELGGRLFASEIVMFMLLPFLLFSYGNKLLRRPVAPLVLLAFMWLAGLIVTDLIRETVYEDYLRGWAKVFFFSSNLVVLYLLLGANTRRWLIFGFGLAIGLLVDYFYSPSEYAGDYFWKFGIGSGITFLIVLLSHKRLLLVRLAPELLVAFAALLNIYFGFRSLGLVCGLTAVFLLIHRRRQRSRLPAVAMHQSKWRGVKLFLVFVVGTYGIVSLYEYAATAGWVGEEEQQKYSIQSSGKWGILLGGRSELLASGQAIIDSPLIGHGSWARNSYYADLIDIRKDELGYEVSGIRQSDLIPSHSYLFGSWVEAGLAGGFFWIYILSRIYKMLRASFLSSARPKPWVIFCIFLLAWDVLFSPMGAQQRIISAYQVVMLMLTLAAFQQDTMVTGRLKS